MERISACQFEVDAIALGAILSACRWDVALSLLREAVADQLRIGPQFNASMRHG